MKVLRSTLLVGTAAVLAACGDKVTVAGPATTTPQVISVSVTPASATLSVNQTITLTAAVNADAGATYTVAWTSSDPTKVSVGAATGVVTAVAATPGVAICAAAGGKTGCATIVVSAAAAVIPASVSIQSVTVNPGGAPVVPTAVAGQIDVFVNVSPGNQTVQRVVLLVGTTRADSQVFTAAQSAALRSAADEAIANQSAFPPILFSVNTASFNATTGVPTWTNGTGRTVSVQLYVTGGTTASATATWASALTFVNANTYTLTSSFTGTTATANSAAGFGYRRGSLSLSVLPVIYTPAITMAAGTITFGSALAVTCDRNGTGPRAVALTAPVAPATAWTATIAFTVGSGAAAGDLDLYEFDQTLGTCPAGTVNAGEGFTVTATDNAGNAFLGAAAPANAAANLYRVDNRPPVVPTLVQNPNFRQNGWINAGVAMTGANTGATSNGWMVNGGAVGCATQDCGVGGYTRLVRIAASATGTVAEAVAATSSNTPTLPAPSLANTTYCGVFSATDLLGNESARPAAATVCTAPAVASSTALGAQHMLFGVDVAGPTIAFSGGLAAMANTAGRFTGGSVGGEFQVTVSDTGITGNSGMLGGSSVRGTVQIRQPVAATTCLVGTVVSGVCTPASVNAAPAFPLVPTTVVAASTVVGYYFYSANSYDAAGNASTNTVTRVVAYDPAANVPTLTTALFNVPISGGSVTFNANSSDNFDLRDIRYTLGYAGGLAGPLAYPATVLNGTPSASAGPAAVVFVNSNVPVPVTIASFVRQVEDVTGNAPITVSGAYKPNALNGILRDQVNLNPAGSPIVTAIPAASVTTGVSYLTLAAPLLPRSWAITNGATNVSTGATVPAANALSVTLNADLFGPTATFNSPFVRVDFYVAIGGNLEQIGTQTAYSTVDDGSAFGRRHRFQLTWTPGTTSPVTATAWVLGAQALYAIGVNAAGDALVTLANGAITITNP